MKVGKARPIGKYFLPQEGKPECYTCAEHALEASRKLGMTQVHAGNETWSEARRMLDDIKREVDGSEAVGCIPKKLGKHLTKYIDSIDRNLKAERYPEAKFDSFSWHLEGSFMHTLENKRCTL